MNNPFHLDIDPPAWMRSPAPEGTPQCGISHPPSGATACVLAAGHGGTVHQDRNTNQWPVVAGAPFGQITEDDEPHPSDFECPCPAPDDQYLMDIDCGSISLTHKACGKSPRGDWMMESLCMDPVPVTVKAVPYGNCDGSMWHGEHQCDCGSLAEVTITGVAS